MTSDVALILERVADAATMVNRSSSAPGNVELYPVVAICGGRGSGKTTAMLEAGARLAEEGHTVLPMLRPDLYSGGESLLMNAIQATRLALAQDGRSDELLSGQPGDVAVTLDQVARQMLRRASAARFDPTNFAGGLDQQVADDSRATEAMSTIESEWASFVAALAPGLPRVIVLIDDLDLATERVSDFLTDLRTMAMADGITFVVALDFDETRRALRAKHDAALATGQGIPVTLANGVVVETASPSYGVVNAQLAKILPPELRVNIHPLSEQDRLGFVPKGETKSVLDLLNEVPLGEYPGTPSFGSLFVAQSGRRVIPTLYASILSSNRRALTSFHHEVSRLLRADHPRRDLQRALARELITHAIEEGIKASNVAGLGLNTFLLFDPPGVDGEQIITIDFTCLRYFSSHRAFAQITGLAAGASRVPRPGEGEADPLPDPEAEGAISPVRSALQVPSGPDPDSDQHTIKVTGVMRSTARLALSDEEVRGPEVGAALTHGLLLARELAGNYGLPGEDLLRGDPPRRGGFGRHVMTIDQTDNEFLILPQWDGYLDPWMFDQFWENIVGATKPVPDMAATSTAAVLDAWNAIGIIQRRRRIPRFRPATARLREESIDFLALAEEILDRLVEVYEDMLERPGIRANDYVDWFEGFLPFGLHPLVMRRDVGDAVWERWRRAVEEAGRWEITRRNVGSLLATRVQRSLGEKWIGPLLEMLERMEWTSHRDLQRRHENRIALLEAQRSRFTALTADDDSDASAPSGGDAELTRAILSTLGRALAETEAELQADAVSFESSED